MGSAYIRDIASLERLRVAIARFCDSCGDLSEIDSTLQTRINNLKSLESKFKYKIESAKDDLRSAQSALRSCEANTHEDSEGKTVDPDCDFERVEMGDCRERLEIAEDKFQDYKLEIQCLEKAVAEYQIQKLKFRNLLQFKKEAAAGCLTQLVSGAEDYLSVATPHSYSATLNDTAATKATTNTNQALSLGIATAGAADLTLLSLFTFAGLSGKKYNVSNVASNGIVTSSLSQDIEHGVCTKLKIENKNEISQAKILSVSIPLSLHQEGIGSHLTNNLEAICRANDCKEIATWTNSANADFYKKMGYQVRSEIKGTGAEVFKVLDSTFLEQQKKAKASFENIVNDGFIKNSGMQFVNPLNIITPEDVTDKEFWSQHNEDLERYVNLIEQYCNCTQLLGSGMTLDEIRKQDYWLANAHDIFTGSEPIQLQKIGEYFKIVGGRHRVAAAQIYFMRTGKTVPIIASIFERA